jgi:hypothetical protein
MAVVEQNDLKGVDEGRVLWPLPSGSEPKAVAEHPRLEPRSSDSFARAVRTGLRWGLLLIALGAIAVVVLLIVGSFLFGG